MRKSLQFILLSETTNTPLCFIWELPGRGRQITLFCEEGEVTRQGNRWVLRRNGKIYQNKDNYLSFIII